MMPAFAPVKAAPIAIADDCTGTITLNANGAMIDLQVVVVDYGLSVQAIVKSDTYRLCQSSGGHG